MSSFMQKHGLRMGLAVCPLMALTACASGDGVPTATIENGLDSCIVEASYLEYGFIDPIGPSGRMSAREVTVGSDVAYAVVMTPGAGETCVDLARKRGGQLWVTTRKYSAEPGQLTRIQFSQKTESVPETATQIETACTPEYVEGLKRFSRLINPCDDGSGGQ